MFTSGFRSPLVRDTNPTLVSLNGLLSPFDSAKQHGKNVTVEVNTDTEVGGKLIDQQDHR